MHGEDDELPKRSALRIMCECGGNLEVLVLPARRPCSPRRAPDAARTITVRCMTLRNARYTVKSSPWCCRVAVPAGKRREKPRHKGVTRTQGGSVSPISVPLLSAGKTYTCTVKATNAVGTGAASASSNAATVATVAGSRRSTRSRTVFCRR